jgi:hypothetical protein
VAKCKSFDKAECIDADNANSCEWTDPCTLKLAKGLAAASTCAGPQLEATCSSKADCEWVGPSSTNKCTHKPEYNADLYGAVAACAAVTTTPADCEAAGRATGSSSSTKCLSFKHYGKCEGEEIGTMTQPTGVTTKQACLDGCQAEASCNNVEYTAATNTCNYYSGKCSQYIEFDTTIEIFAK